MNEAKVLKDGITKFIKDVERREKTIEASVESAWKEINRKDANTATLEWYAKDIHDYKVILNELKNVKRELNGILYDLEDYKRAATIDGWHRED